MQDTNPTVPLKPAIKDPNNVEAKKFYIFNETGNIMIASTVEPSQPIEESVRKIFAEVSVFFAGMTRAISTTINPETKQPYSIYNYAALERIIGGSGLFVKVTEEDVTYETKSFGVDFSKELLEYLLGLATGSGEMGFAAAMMASIGKEGLRISGSSSQSESKVGNIVFVCEYLLGMPLVSAIVVYADCKMNKQQLSVGPCFKEQSTSTSWKLHKDTYFFVTPTFIRDYASDLDSIRSDPNYVALINWLQGLLNRTLAITGVYDASDISKPAGPELSPSASYKMLGEFLPEAKGSLKFKQGAGQVTAGNWSATEIDFSVSGSQSQAAPIEILTSDGAVVGSTSQSYTIKGSKLAADKIDIGEITTTNPFLWMDPNTLGTDLVRYEIATNCPHDGWLAMNQFCSLLSAAWLQRRGQGPVPAPFGMGTFSDPDKVSMASRLIGFANLEAQVRYAVEVLHGAQRSRGDVVAGMSSAGGQAYPVGTRIWAGSDGHVIACFVISALEYELYDPEDGGVIHLARSGFAGLCDAYHCNAFVVA